MVKVRRQNLAGQVYALVKRDILNLRLVPGEKINLSQIARSMDISLSPLREAISRLVQDELVRYVPRRGYCVIELTASDIKDLFHLRGILESDALSDFFKKDRSVEMENLGRLKTEMIALRKESNVRRKQQQFWRTEVKLHKVILGLSDNLRLRKVFAEMLDLSVLAWRLYQSYHREVDKPLNEHIAIMDAILESKLDKAGKLLCAHIHGAEKRLLKASAESQSVVTKTRGRAAVPLV